MGVCVAGNPSDLRRCNAAVFRRGQFFEGLRVVNSGGTTYEVVRARIRRPATAVGQWLVHLFDLDLTVDVELRPIGLVSLAEVRRVMQRSWEEDAEGFEEQSGRSIDWWKRSLESCADLPSLIRLIQAAGGRRQE